MKKYVAIFVAILVIAPLVAKGQEPTISHVTPRSYHLNLVNGQVVYILDTIEYPPFYTTQREKDSIRIPEFTDLLREDHLWLSYHVWRTDSADGIFRRNRITRNEGNLREADSTFTARYGNRYTAK